MHTKYKGHETRAEPRGWGGVGLHVEADVVGPAVQRLRGRQLSTITSVLVVSIYTDRSFCN